MKNIKDFFKRYGERVDSLFTTLKSGGSLFQKLTALLEILAYLAIALVLGYAVWYLVIMFFCFVLFCISLICN
jgi:hypothetical protein